MDRGTHGKVPGFFLLCALSLCFGTHLRVIVLQCSLRSQVIWRVEPISQSLELQRLIKHMGSQGGQDHCSWAPACPWLPQSKEEADMSSGARGMFVQMTHELVQ